MTPYLTAKQIEALRLINADADEDGYVENVNLVKWGPTEIYHEKYVLMNASTARSLDKRGLIVVLGSDVAWVEEITDAGRDALEIEDGIDTTDTGEGDA